MKISITIVTIFVLISCHPATWNKASYLNRFEAFVASVESRHSEMDMSEWSELDSEFLKYSHDFFHMHRSSMTDDELGYCRLLRTRYHAAKVQSSVQSVRKQGERWLLQAENLLFSESED